LSDIFSLTRREEPLILAEDDVNTCKLLIHLSGTGLPNPNLQNQEFLAKKPGVDQEILT
jgi:hypothetical protein